MTAPLLRLGDEIDDYCPRCKLLLNHAVASMVGGTVVKVVCQTCHSEHPYKNAEVPPKKKSGPRAALLDQVLAKVAPAAPDPEPVEKPPSPKKPRSPARRNVPLLLPAILPGTPPAPAEALAGFPRAREGPSQRWKAADFQPPDRPTTRTLSRETSSYSVPRHSIRRVNPATTKFPSMIHGTSGDNCQ